MIKNKIKVKIEKEFPNLEEYEKFLIEEGILEKDSSGKLKLSEKTYADVFTSVMVLSTTFNIDPVDEILEVCAKKIDENHGYDILQRTTSYKELVERVKEFQKQTRCHNG